MKRKTRPSRRRTGFTIVEIIVVVIIIAALAALISRQYFGRIGQAKHSVAVANLQELEKAIETFSYDYSRLPESIEDLVSRPDNITEADWNPPSLKAKHLNDPWGRQYVYKQPGDHGPYDLYSLGADGQVGGEKDNADVNNWE